MPSRTNLIADPFLLEIGDRIRKTAGGIAAIGKRISVGLADPRVFQAFFLGILLAVGAWFRDFSLYKSQIILTFASAIATQYLSFPLRPDKPRSYRSAIITGLGLTLLLRADNLWAHPVAAAMAILSKSMFRFHSKHIFNPAAFGVAFALIFLPGTWISPGQWGQDLAAAGWIFALGAFVAGRARRADISWCFLGFYVGALAMRVVWLGYRWAVLEHQLLNGALLLFAFFMISDPMTSPNHSRGRALHSAIVAAIAMWWRFHLYRQNALILALVIAAPMVPLWDHFWTAPNYQWKESGGNHEGLAMAVLDRDDASSNSASRSAA